MMMASEKVNDCKVNFLQKAVQKEGRPLLWFHWHIAHSLDKVGCMEYILYGIGNEVRDVDDESWTRFHSPPKFVNAESDQSNTSKVIECPPDTLYH